MMAANYAILDRVAPGVDRWLDGLGVDAGVAHWGNAGLRGLPCVEVKLKDGKHLKMLIDTGHLSSVLDAKVANDFRLEALSLP